MLDLFKKYREDKRLSETIIAGRNMVNKNPGNYEMFKEYMEFLLDLAKHSWREAKKEFIAQATVMLAFFSENADLTEEIVTEIRKYEETIDKISLEIEKEEKERYDSGLKAIHDKNNEQIKKLYNIKNELTHASVRSEFDEILKKISDADKEIDHEEMTEEQEKSYNYLNKACTDCISEKMRWFEIRENKEYNKRAIDAFERAFNRFKNDEGNYKNQNQLHALVSSTLFAYDASRLFNETLIYYNHIYSYIFSKLDDDGKLALTRLSIECERKGR